MHYYRACQTSASKGTIPLASLLALRHAKGDAAFHFSRPHSARAPCPCARGLVKPVVSIRVASLRAGGHSRNYSSGLLSISYLRSADWPNISAGRAGGRTILYTSESGELALARAAAPPRSAGPARPATGPWTVVGAGCVCGPTA